MVLEHKYGGEMSEIKRQYGVAGASALNIRFNGAIEREDTGTVDAVEIIMRGRHSVTAKSKQNPKRQSSHLKKDDHYFSRIA